MNTTRSLPAWAVIVAVALSLCACGGAAGPGTVVIIDDRGRGAPQMTFGGVKLLATPKQVIELATAKGWKHNVKDEDGPDVRAFVLPDDKHDVRRFSLIFQARKLVSMNLEYRKADPTRHGMVSHFARKKRLPDGAWAMTDGRRDVVVIVNRDADRLSAVHTGKLSDRAEADKLLKHFIGENASDRPAAAEKDPKSSDASKP